LAEDDRRHEPRCDPCSPHRSGLSARRGNPALGLAAIRLGFLMITLEPDRPTNESDAAAATVVGPVGFGLVDGGVLDV
jgi:hypothetical protein